MNTGSVLLVLWAHPLRATIAGLFFALLFFAFRAVYRIYLHPLSKFPGPREAAVSDGWLHKLSRDGHQEEEFERLHQLYNTHALRIGPNELHLSDVSKYKTIYGRLHPYPKEVGFYECFGTPHTVFVETDFALHKERRRILNPFFARSGIFKIEASLHEHVGNPERKLRRLSDQGLPICALNAFRCVTIDVITEFAFAGSRHLIDKSNDNFDASFLSTFDAVSDIFWDSYYSPVMRKVGSWIPECIIVKISKEVAHILALRDEGADSLKAYQSSLPKGDNNPVIFDVLGHLPDEEIVSEGVDFLVGGSDTTTFTILSGVWNLCENPTIKQKLTTALKEAVPNRAQGDPYPALPQLEAVPYLSACIKESLRFGMAVPGRLPRTVPGPANNDPLIIDDKVVPPGVTVGMSAYTMHLNEEVWGANAREFCAERWLGEAGKGMDAHLVTFSTGVRSCIGQNLAMAELTFMFFMLFGCFDVEVDRVAIGELTTKDTFTRAVQAPGVFLKLG